MCMGMAAFYLTDSSLINCGLWAIPENRVFQKMEIQFFYGMSTSFGKKVSYSIDDYKKCQNLMTMHVFHRKN